MVLRPRDILELLLVASMTTIEAIKRERLSEATGTTATPTPTAQSTARDGGGVSKE